MPVSCSMLWRYNQLEWLWVGICLLVSYCSGAHFGGGMLSWRPSTNSAMIIADVRLSWELSRVSCINKIEVLQNPVLTCSACGGSIAVTFYCTDSSSVGYSWDSWASARGIATLVSKYELDNPTFTYSFTGNAWIEIGGWSLSSSVNLAMRNDTGNINTPPVTDMIPIITWITSYSHTLQIPVWDADGDIVKCRLAIGLEECGDVCNGFPEATLDQENCIVSYNAGQLTTGYRHVALQIEDFAVSDPNTALSSIPLQFLVYLYPGSLDNSPMFINPTPESGDIIFYEQNKSMSFNVTAMSLISFNTVETISPIGFEKTIDTWQDTSSRFYINATLKWTTWTPFNADEAKAHVICFAAINNVGQASEVRCVHFHEASISASVIGQICKDDTNCITSNSECMQLPEGGFCTCMDGYVASLSGMLCEQETGLGGECTANDTCITDNSYCTSVCACLPGFVASSSSETCEQETGLGGNCTVTATCTTTHSTCSGTSEESTCVCAPGFTISSSGLDCEQEAGLGGECTANDTCITDNSYCSSACACLPGFVASSSFETCEQETGLGGNCTVTATCTTNHSTCSGSSEGSACVCKSGFTVSNSGLECEQETSLGGNCTVSATCTTQHSTCSGSSEGSTCVCEPGFTVSNTSLECEQETGLGGECTANDTCITDNSYCSSGCACLPGFVASSSSDTCEQETGIGGNCSVNATCTTNHSMCSGSSEGSTCVCASGFTVSNSGHECEHETGIGGNCTVSATCKTSHATCSGTSEGSTCVCETGFTVSNSGLECEQETGLGGECTANDTCITDNSYCSSGCACLPGFVASSTFETCEQETGLGGNCTVTATCTTTHSTCSGSVEGSLCVCASGFTVSNSGLECEQETGLWGNCTVTATCTTTHSTCSGSSEGSTCVCEPGFTISNSGLDCEQETGLGGECTANDTCITDNSYCSSACTCLPGYVASSSFETCEQETGLGGNCTVTATCKSSHAMCSGTSEGSTCVCEPGYTISNSGLECEQAPIGGKCGPTLHCRTPGAACVNSVCTCDKTDVFSKEFDLCDTMDLFNYNTVHDTTFNAVQSNTEVVTFTAGIPVMKTVHTKVYVTSNGIISFGSKFTNPTPQKDGSDLTNRTVVAPYYSNINGGTVHYRIYNAYADSNNVSADEVTLIEQLTTKFGKVDSFKAKFVVLVTWRNVIPYTNNDGTHQEATFQLVLVSDGVDTFAMYIYGHDQMKWSDVRPPDIWIGFTSNGTDYDSHVHSFTKFASRMDIYAEFRGVKGLLFYRLTSAGNTKPNPTILCFDWFNQNKHRQADLSQAASTLPHCQCDINRLRLDPWYKQFTVDNQPDDVECAIFQATEKHSPHGKICCYNTTTRGWINERPYAGTYVEYHPDISPTNYTLYDTSIKNACCVQSSNCQLYYQLKPIGQCYNETNQQFASTWGDPHIRTLDGLEYTFNGLGEFILARAEVEGGMFELQARTGRAPLDDGRLSEDATVFTAFAATDPTGAWVHVELDNSKKGLTIYSNKGELTNKFKKEKNKKEFEHSWDNMTVKRNGTTLVVLFTKPDIALEITVGERLLKMRTFMPTTLRNKTRGLLGDFDGNPNNDIMAPNGTRPEAELSERIAYEYGLLWEVDKSILEYDGKKTHADYRFPLFKPRFLDEVSPERKQEALEYCENEENQACIFDYVFTESRSVAIDTLGTGLAATDARDEIESVTPFLSGCEETFASVGQEVSCLLAYDEADDVRIEFLDNDVGAQYNQSTKTVKYTITSTEPPNMKIVAVKQNKAKVKTSSPIQVPVRFCSGCNGQGNCSATEVRQDKREKVKFQYAVCECRPEYEGDDCEDDFDGCAAKPCSLGRPCTDLSPARHSAVGDAYECGNCPDGYSDDGNQCADIDECNIGADDCEHNCSNTEGGYICTCVDGFRPNADNRSQCDDINECNEARHDCPHTCDNTPGGYECSCLAGHTLNNSTNECNPDFDPGVSPCDVAGLNCTLAHGCTTDDQNTSTCFCRDGYQLADSGNECEDIDECAGQLCDMNCENYDGGFDCSCLAGYTLKDVLTCQPCEPSLWGDGCFNVCDCSAVGTKVCNHVRGCVCKTGWTGDQCSEDIDECRDDPNICGNVRKVCVNTDGQYYCTCRDGYEEHEGGCRDINECADATLNRCEQNCVNTVGKYVCSCEEGYTKSGHFSCRDIDECNSRRTGCEHLCENYPGLYRCTCHYGFILNDDRRTCRKDATVNPCKGYTDLACEQICVVSNDDVAGCKCAMGYELGKDGMSCHDINECSTVQPCSGDAICENTAGAYNCKCPLGSKLENDEETCTECDDFHYGEDCAKVCSCLNGRCDKITGCVCDDGWTGEDCDKDKNECQTTPGLCGGENEVCLNVFGGYKCVCKQGFTRDSHQLCIDVNECADKRSNNCTHMCNNIPGGFICSCRKGFLEVDGTCVDIDECGGTHGCDYGCFNTLGNYRCSCPASFDLDRTDRKTCIPAKTCTDEEQANCSENADCYIVDGTPQCKCRKGFVGDGLECTDIEECAAEVSPCMHNCMEEDGSYHCECDVGYILDTDKASCKVCDSWSYGKNCGGECVCNQAASRYCDPVNGTCYCNEGWSNVTCNTDINECEQSDTQCPEKSRCMNTYGSYVCRCDVGYLMTNYDVCEVCDTRHFGENCASQCGCNVTTTASCDNVNGSCLCMEGWEGSDCSVNKNECEDPDSCSEQANSVCNDTPGSFVCVCEEGYTETNGICADINECLDRYTVIECPSTDSRQCINEPGSYRCECRRGYSGDGVTCSVCTDNTYGHNCSGTCPCDVLKVTDDLQKCDPVNGTCHCNSKWTGDLCEVNVNECLNNDACLLLPNTGCYDVEDGFECDCFVGFEKQSNGSCLPVPPREQVNGTTRQMTVTFDVELPPGTNLQVKKVYDEVKADVEESLTKHLRSYLPGEFNVTVISMRLGSIIVDYVVTLEDDTADHGKLYEAVTGLSQIEFRNQTVTARSDLSGNIMDPCAVYTSMLGECGTGYKCEIDEDRPSCRLIPDQDTFKLVLGLSVGLALFVLVLVLLLICARLSAAKRREERHRKLRHNGHVTREPGRRNKTSRPSDSTERIGTAPQETVNTSGWTFYNGKQTERPRSFESPQSVASDFEDDPYRQTGYIPSWRNMRTDQMVQNDISNLWRPKKHDYKPKILHDDQY